MHSCGAKLSDQELLGYNSLMEASTNGHLNIVEYLHCQGADIVERCMLDGYSSIMLASMYGHLQVVSYLCKFISNFEDYHQWVEEVFLLDSQVFTVVDKEYA